MATDEPIFVYNKQSRGDFVGVLECDNDAGHFYLYWDRNPSDRKVIDAIWIFNGEPDFTEQDVKISWSMNERLVGLFIRGKLWAVFDTFSGTKYGGNYKSLGEADIPRKVATEFIQ